MKTPNIEPGCSILDAAASWAAAGFHPLALHGLDSEGRCSCGGPHPNGRGAGKHPIERDWQKSELDIGDVLLELREDSPRNLGLRMGRQPKGERLLAIDDDGGLAEFEARQGVLPRTLTLISGGGGRHRLFLVPDDVMFKNHVKLDGLAIDIRCDGGQIVVAPSLHISGKRYSIGDDCALARLPEAALEKLSRRPPEPPNSPAKRSLDDDGLRNRDSRIQAYLASKCQEDPSVQGSDGSAALTRWCGTIFWKLGLSESEGWPLLCEMNLKAASPPWSESELRHAMANGMQPHPSRPDSRGALLDRWRREDEENTKGNSYMSTNIRAAAPLVPMVPSLVLRGSTHIFAKLPPIDWLCEGLEMAPGAPSLWAGYGFTGKTMAAQRFALSIATGHDYGSMRVKRGKVLHLDYEQGSMLTYRRYQRLSIGMGIWAQEVAERLSVVPLPSLYLSDVKAESILAKACDGHALCMVDSFRASCPAVDENSSEARVPLDIMNRVSEKTGCHFMVIHHAKKPASDGKESFGKRMSIRGSSGIYDACASVLVFDGVKGEPTRIYHEKARLTGKESGDLLMSMRDVDDGIEFELSSAPEVISVKGTSAERNAPAILAFVAAHPGCSMASVRQGVTMKRNTVCDLIHSLLESGKLVNMGAGRSGAGMSLYVVALPTEPSY